MSDRVRIDIDCDAMTASIDSDRLRFVAMGTQIQDSRSFLIAQALIPQIKALMGTSSDQLKAIHLEQLTKGLG